MKNSVSICHDQQLDKLMSYLICKRLQFLDAIKIDLENLKVFASTLFKK